MTKKATVSELNNKQEVLPLLAVTDPGNATKRSDRDRRRDFGNPHSPKPVKVGEKPR